MPRTGPGVGAVRLGRGVCLQRSAVPSPSVPHVRVSPKVFSSRLITKKLRKPGSSLF